MNFRESYEKNAKILVHLPGFVDEKKATEIFDEFKRELYFLSEVKNHLHPQYSYPKQKFPHIFEYIQTHVVDELRKTYDFYPVLSGALITYLDGKRHHVFSHYHPASTELKISFGQSRPVTIEDKEYQMANGSVVLFGPKEHSVPSVEGEQFNLVLYYSNCSLTNWDTLEYPPKEPEVPESDNIEDFIFSS